jgi:hypothetical protein
VDRHITIPKRALVMVWTATRSSHAINNRHTLKCIPFYPSFQNTQHVLTGREWMNKKALRPVSARRNKGRRGCARDTRQTAVGQSHKAHSSLHANTTKSFGSLSLREKDLDAQHTHTTHRHTQTYIHACTHAHASLFLPISLRHLLSFLSLSNTHAHIHTHIHGDSTSLACVRGCVKWCLGCVCRLFVLKL